MRFSDGGRANFLLGAARRNGADYAELAPDAVAPAPTIDRLPTISMNTAANFISWLARRLSAPGRGWRLLLSLFWCVAWSGGALAAVTFQAGGNAISGTTSAGLTVSWPAHAQGDVALLFVESAGGQPVTLGVANGFAPVANSPQFTGAGTTGTRLTVFWARAT
jgi:hypothetical protein